MIYLPKPQLNMIIIVQKEGKGGKNERHINTNMIMYLLYFTLK